VSTFPKRATRDAAVLEFEPAAAMVRSFQQQNARAPMETLKPADHPEIKAPRVGVLLLNLGTPDAPDYRSMRRYLSEFLSDRRVIATNPLVWQQILQGIILNVRPQKSGENYRKIWDNEAGDSPLRVISRHQAEKLQARLGSEV